ncbi:hypothetical protein IW261DRAFT_1425102 [Armillaria novae-zelandiae]|uniref:Uncharacterized protein n=1 Tax=Armillaria novae-zelandiae TaxID=153914 RepID=A0AA39U637_9AGAR|nr:hypothetical protein IW261DRAFT_1425102 [Armillaria novae-zelandiae]
MRHTPAFSLQLSQSSNIEFATTSTALFNMTMDMESQTTGQQHQYQAADGHFPTQNTSTSSTASGSLPNSHICQYNLNDSDCIIEVSLCDLASSQGMKVVFNMGALVPGDYSITLTLKLANSESDMDPLLVTGTVSNSEPALLSSTSGYYCEENLNLVNDEATITSTPHSPHINLRTITVNLEDLDSQSQTDYNSPTKYNFWCEHFMDLGWPFPEKLDDSDVGMISGLTHPSRTRSESVCFSKALHALSPALFNQWFETCAWLAKIVNALGQIPANAEELSHSKSLGPSSTQTRSCADSSAEFLQTLSESTPVRNFMEMDSQPWDSDPSGFPGSFPETPT